MENHLRLVGNQLRAINYNLFKGCNLASLPQASFAKAKLAQRGWYNHPKIVESNAARALITLTKDHDPATGQHMQQVGTLLLKSSQLFELVGAEAQKIILAGWLHDIGKRSLPKSILNKPGALTEEEWVLMRTHCEIGARMVSRFPSLRSLAPLIRAHHERWDGRGYPDGLRGLDIPLGARMIAVVDAYLAMTEDRSYQKARSHSSALAELRRCAGSQFDPLLVERMENLLLTDSPLPQNL